MPGAAGFPGHRQVYLDPCSDPQEGDQPGVQALRAGCAHGGEAVRQQEAREPKRARQGRLHDGTIAIRQFGWHGLLPIA